MPTLTWDLSSSVVDGRLELTDKLCSPNCKETGKGGSGAGGCDKLQTSPEWRKGY
jgi:hypothetical protein